MNHAVAKETPRGWKITKEKQSHKIDMVTSEWIGVHAGPRTGFAGAPGFGGTPEDVAWQAVGGCFGGGGRNGSVVW
jgi:hypothetical protein